MGEGAGRLTPSGTPVAALVLAAGLGVRFGGAKLATDFEGKPLVAHLLDTIVGLAAHGVLGPVVVVHGAGPDAGSDAAIVQRLASERGFLVAANDDPAAGMARSLRIGLAALATSDASAALVLLGDQPRTSRQVIGALLAAFRAGDGPMLVPRYRNARGRPGNPVLLRRDIWPLAGELRGERGMREIARRRPDLVTYVDVEGANVDVDRPADLASLSRRASTEGRIPPAR